MDFFAVLEAKKANAVKPKSKDNDDEVEGVPTDADESEDEEPPTATDDADKSHLSMMIPKKHHQQMILKRNLPLMKIILLRRKNLQ